MLRITWDIYKELQGKQGSHLRLGETTLRRRGSWPRRLPQKTFNTIWKIQLKTGKLKQKTSKHYENMQCWKQVNKKAKKKTP